MKQSWKTLGSHLGELCTKLTDIHHRPWCLSLTVQSRLQEVGGQGGPITFLLRPKFLYPQCGLRNSQVSGRLVPYYFFPSMWNMLSKHLSLYQTNAPSVSTSNVFSLQIQAGLIQHILFSFSFKGEASMWWPLICQSLLGIRRRCTSWTPVILR